MRSLEEVDYKELRNCCLVLNEAMMLDGEEEVSLLPRRIATTAIKKDDLVQKFLGAVESVSEENEQWLPEEVTKMYNFIVSDKDGGGEGGEAVPEPEEFMTEEPVVQSPPQKKEKKEKKEKRTEKKVECNRTTAFCDSLKEGPGPKEDLIKRGNEIAVKSGLKSNENEMKYAGSIVLKALVHLGYVVEKDGLFELID